MDFTKNIIIHLNFALIKLSDFYNFNNSIVCLLNLL